MFSKNRTKESTGSCSEQIERLQASLETADAIIIGAGAGLSTSAGLTYSGERFERYFSDFHQKYGIFDMYGQQGMGYNAIAYRLNDMHIPARKGQWSQTSVANILTNEVYLGKIRWRREPVKKVIKDGMLSKKRIQNDEYELYDGLHEPIITEEQWERVKAAQKQRNHNPVNADHTNHPAYPRKLSLIGDRRKEPPVEIGFEEGYCVPFTG